MEKQYLLVVRDMKGFPRFQLMNVANNYDTLNDPNFGTVNGGMSLNEVLSEPNGNEFTLMVSE